MSDRRLGRQIKDILSRHILAIVDHLLQFGVSRILIRITTGQVYNTGRRCHCFQTACLTTGTLDWLLEIHGNVTKFTPSTSNTVDQVAIRNHTTADTSTQCHKDHIRIVGTRTNPLLTKSRHVGIVVNKEWNSKRPFNLLLDWLLRFPVEVVGTHNRPLVTIDHTRRTHTNPQEILG